MPESTSEFAEEGRLAHSVAELKARKKFMVLSNKEFNAALKKLQKDPLYQPEMLEHADTYVESLTELAMSYASRPSIALEVQVQYDQYVPEGFGTSDCIMVGGDTLDVVDYKYGKGVPVQAEDNPQMKLYAVGALLFYSVIYGDAITKIRMTIVQPRLNSFSTWVTDRGELIRWADEYVKPRAELAWEGKGEPAGGDWCRFCRIKATCRHRAGTITALEAFGGALPPVISDAEVGDLLIRGAQLKSWYSDLEDYALKACLEGKDIPGWKAVEGRSIRQFTSQDEALETIMAQGYARGVIYDYVPKTLSALEKMMGKTAFDEAVGSFIHKPPGKPTLVTVKDKRPPYNAAEVAFKAQA